MQLQRVWELLYNMIKIIEDAIDERIIEFDINYEIGIGNEEYDEIVKYKP